MNFIQAYISAFQTCYPQKNIRTRFAGTQADRTPQWWVIIDHDRGERPLTEADMKSATRDFQRGRVH